MYREWEELKYAGMKCDNAEWRRHRAGRRRTLGHYGTEPGRFETEMVDYTSSVAFVHDSKSNFIEVAFDKGSFSTNTT